mmetsp:Transcript_4111/g.9133  ORF Transcript_4111/g.9133 Transcript_4111/m.9133 type:complete len:215 (-) Transcript_4111:309-953(-)
MLHNPFPHAFHIAVRRAHGHLLQKFCQALCLPPSALFQNQCLVGENETLFVAVSFGPIADEFDVRFELVFEHAVSPGDPFGDRCGISVLLLLQLSRVQWRFRMEFDGQMFLARVQFIEQCRKRPQRTPHQYNGTFHGLIPRDQLSRLVRIMGLNRHGIDLRFRFVISLNLERHGRPIAGIGRGGERLEELPGDARAAAGVGCQVGWWDGLGFFS